MNTAAALTVYITNALTLLAALTIVGLTAASCLHIVLYQRDLRRPSAHRNLAIAIACILVAIVVLILWTKTIDRSSPPAHTTGPSTVEGQ